MEEEDVQLKSFFMSSLGLLVRELIHFFTFLILFYFSAILYGVHLTDKESFEKYSVQYNAGFLSTVFTFIDNYSPFHEVNIYHLRIRIIF